MIYVMARSLVREFISDLCVIRNRSSIGYLSPIYTPRGENPVCEKEFVSYNCNRGFLSDVLSRAPLSVYPRFLCSSIKPRRLCWEGSSRDILLKNLESFLRNHQVDEAWEAYTDFKKLYGLPDGHLLSRFITEMSYSQEPKWLQRASDVILFLSKEHPNLLRLDMMYNLSLCLARSQMPVPASMILRLMVEKVNIPPNNLLRPFILHMVKNEVGTYLASNILIQICDHFQGFGSNRSTHADFIKHKPDTAIFNLVLDACSRYNLSFKAQQIIELMSQIGVVGDAHTIITIAQIHVINGQRDELQKFKHCVDQAEVYLSHHYFQFYDSLLSLHFKFHDIDSASTLVYDMISRRGTLPNLADRNGLNKPFLIPLGSRNLRMGLKLQVLPHILQENSLVKLKRNEGLVMHKNGKFLLSNKALAKFIVRYKRMGRISELSKLVNHIRTEQGSLEMENLSSDVIDACIHVGWLETAHDIMDDIEREGNFPNSDSYTSLLMAYNESKKHREAEALLNQIQKAGIVITSDKPTVSSKKPDLIKFLVQEIKDSNVDCSIYNFNSSIYFFTKAKMIDDALKTYHTMRKTEVSPTVATYIYMIMGYSSLEMYREMAILWGDIKRSCDDGNLLINRDLYEVLIINFLKGGYFERVMEVIGCMKKHGMYPDKWLYQSEFLKQHKNLYKKLKSSNARTEAQCQRIAHVKAFRKWAGID